MVEGGGGPNIKMNDLQIRFISVANSISVATSLKSSRLECAHPSDTSSENAGADACT